MWNNNLYNILMHNDNRYSRPKVNTSGFVSESLQYYPHEAKYSQNVIPSYPQERYQHADGTNKKNHLIEKI